MKKKIFLKILAILLILAICITALILLKGKKDVIIGKNGKVDDWKYAEKDMYEKSSSSSLVSTNSKGLLSILSSESVDSAMSTGQSFNSSETIGFSVGGAKDVENFRENLKNGYFPISTDITYNGLFYDYTFNTGKKNNSEDLFSPSYSKAISKDPVSNENEYYMTVGLNSNIKESDFHGKKLNLVVVLDISGSMDSTLTSYYYDRYTKENYEQSKDDSKTKMELANESVNILLDELNDEDRFGMVLFDDDSYVAKDLLLIENTDINAIKNHILEIKALGGTNFEAGYTKATKLFNEYQNIDSNEYENRIIVITDAMPNYGTISKDGLMNYVQENADNGIYTSFIGVGVDFNTELIEKITEVKGANYYSVHTAEDFKSRMGEQFEFMVTPLVFDLKLKLESEGYKIEEIYGSDSVNKDTGEIMKVNTLFPSKTTDTGEVKGGVVLLKLAKISENTSDNIKLSVEYKDRNGKQYENTQEIKFEEKDEFYENDGIRKAIVLTRYVNVLKNWILYERSEDKRFIIKPECGITDCNMSEDKIYSLLGENERSSVKLTVSKEYKSIFEELKKYMEQEIKEINDNSMKQELEILDNLINY